MGAGVAEGARFHRMMMMAEKQLENNMETNLATSSKFVLRNLNFVGCQHENSVGPVNMLAMGRDTGQYHRTALPPHGLGEEEPRQGHGRRWDDRRL